MTLDEMKLAVCEKLPDLIIYTGNKDSDVYSLCWMGKYEIHWPTEGLQVCHEAEKLLINQFTTQEEQYWRLLGYVKPHPIYATYEQRLEALCRVWFPEKFKS